MSKTTGEMKAELFEPERWTAEEMDSKMNIMHNMDCLEFMRKVPDDYFDLCLTDPPYGIDAAHERYTLINETWVNKKRAGYITKEWDKSPPEQIYFNEIIYTLSGGQFTISHEAHN